MKPQSTLNRWRAEANRLPAPFIPGTRQTSPGGVPFKTVAIHGEAGTSLGWEVCTREWTPVGISFRRTPFAE